MRPKRILRKPDTRRFPRAEAEWDVTVETPGRRPQKAKLSGLNPFGAKLHLRARQSAAPEGTTLQIHFGPPDGEPPMVIKGLVWRIDRDGQAIVFVNLSGSDFLRLKKLVAAAPLSHP
ncbi:MAG: hypothetical protein HYU24_15890 [Candidatus Rokubacteria bacterium]|nr:hypothetical protein [Candidatus Rokubacteria bacterium]